MLHVPGCHVPRTSEEEYFQRKSLGTAGGEVASLTPTDTAVTPALLRKGMAPWVIPETFGKKSRHQVVVLVEDIVSCFNGI